MATAGEILDEARDYHPSFSPQNFPPRMLLRRLGRAELALHTLVAGLEPELLAVSETVGKEELQAALEGRTPLPLPPYLALASARVWGDSGSRKLHLLDTSQTLSPGAPFPSATAVAAGLVLTDLRDLGRPEHGWEWVTRIEVRLVPAPAPLEMLEEALSSPDMMTTALVGALVSFMAVRAGLDNPGLVSMAEREEAALVALASTHGQATSWRVEPTV